MWFGSRIFVVHDLRLSVHDVMFVCNSSYMVMIFPSIIYRVAWNCSNCRNVL